MLEISGAIVLASTVVALGSPRIGSNIAVGESSASDVREEVLLDSSLLDGIVGSGLDGLDLLDDISLFTFSAILIPIACKTSSVKPSTIDARRLGSDGESSGKVSNFAGGGGRVEACSS